jgi:ABC-2 type transport system ATP-binding protein
MSAEAAAAAFARASAQDAAASSSTAARPETTSDPADTALGASATLPRGSETTAAETTAVKSAATETPVTVATDSAPSVADAPVDAEQVDAGPVDTEPGGAATSDADTVAASSGWPGAVDVEQSGAPLPDATAPRTESDARADDGVAIAKASPSSGLLGRLRRALSGRSTISTPASTPTPTPTPTSTLDDERESDGDVVDAPSSTVPATVAAPDTDAAVADANGVAEGASVSSALEPETVDPGGAVAPSDEGVVLSVRGLAKSFGDTHAVDSVDLDVHAGSFYGIVGPNGAGKTTTLSMMTGLLRPDAGTVRVNGIDVWADPAAAKRTIGVLPDRLRVFDRLTGAQLLYYAGTLRGLRGDVVRGRVEDLARAFGLEDAMGRLVSDYSAGMVKKVSLAAAMIHSPRVLILDEPFESVDPVSAAKVVDILRVYVDNGGTVILSSHSMDFIQRVCDDVAIIVEGQVLAAGPVEDVRGAGSLEERFLELAGGRKAAEGMEWLHSFSG